MYQVDVIHICYDQVLAHGRKIDATCAVLLFLFESDRVSESLLKSRPLHFSLLFPALIRTNAPRPAAEIEEQSYVQAEEWSLT